jgi:hypothetical protein
MGRSGLNPEGIHSLKSRISYEIGKMFSALAVFVLHPADWREVRGGLSSPRYLYQVTILGGAGQSKELQSFILATEYVYIFAAGHTSDTISYPQDKPCTNQALRIVLKFKK